MEKLLLLPLFRCKLNCEAKVNPTQKLALVAACLNCKLGDEKPIYSWEMYKKTPGEEEFITDDTSTLKEYAVTNISKDQNLVIRPNALSDSK